MLQSCLLTFADQPSVSCLLISIGARIIIGSWLTKGHHWAANPTTIGTPTIANHLTLAAIIATCYREWSVALTNSLLLVSV